MIVLLLERVPVSLRGELTRWLLELKAGVFVGKVSAAVRDKLWEKACEQAGGGGCHLVQPAANEQGFTLRSFGQTTRLVEDFEGLQLIRRPLTEDAADSADKAEPDLLFQLWAKTDPFHPLPCHMVDVGNVALALLENGPFHGVVTRFVRATGCPADQTAAWLAYLAALHDLGKCSSAFQAKSPTFSLPLRAMGLSVEPAEEFRHEGLSAEWALDFLIDEKQGWNQKCAVTVADCIRGHHGNFGAREEEEVPAALPQWADLRAQLERSVRSVFQPGAWQPQQFPDHSSAGLLLSGLIVLADWIASNRELFTLEWANESLADYAVHSRGMASRALQRLGFTGQHPWASPMTFRQVWPNIKEPRTIQTACEALVKDGTGPGLAIVEAMMGEGKSEAALYLASQWLGPAEAAGIYMALPTAATSNQMYGRVHDFLKLHDPEAAESVLLVHGTSWLLDAASPDRTPELFDDQPDAGDMALEWFRPRKRSLLSPFGLGTIDQALMGALHVKHGFLRLFGLAGKALIVDEVHAYDTYMNQILTRLLQWCGVLGIPTILLSATLPRARRQALLQAYAPGAAPLAPGQSAYPLITVTGASCEVREISVAASGRTIQVALQPHPGLLGDPQAIANEVAKRVRLGGCICVVANTVDSAQAIFRALEGLVANDSAPVDLLLFHARFPVARRQEIEEAVLRRFDRRSLDAAHRQDRPDRAVLVATQVVEQSLDLDFDEMFTEIAPIDLLLQRAGRLHRHDGRTRSRSGLPILHLLQPIKAESEFGPTGKVYHEYILLRTMQVLDRVDAWQFPDDIRKLVEDVYREDPPAPGSELAAAFADWDKKQKREADVAMPFLIPEPSMRAFKLPRKGGQVILEEHDEGSTSYFHARTRLGDRTMKVLLVEGDAFRRELSLSKVPPHHRLRQIYLQTVSIPKWWLDGSTAVEGFRAPVLAPTWLSGTTVLFLHNGRWTGRTKGGGIFTIALDDTYGMVRETDGGSPPATD